MTTSARRTISLLISLAFVGCSAESTLTECGGGASHDADGVRYCVYGGELIIEGFECPGSMVRHDPEPGLVVCAPDELPDETEHEIVEEYSGEDWCVCENDDDCDCPTELSVATCRESRERPVFVSDMRSEPLGESLERFGGLCEEPTMWTTSPDVYVDGEPRDLATVRSEPVTVGAVVTFAYQVPGDESCRLSAYNPQYEITNSDGTSTGSISDGAWTIGPSDSDRWAVVEVFTFAECEGTYSINVANIDIMFSTQFE